MILKSIEAIAIVLILCVAILSQTKTFTPVEGASLKAKVESAVIIGKANAPAGRFWIGYQFEVRPGWLLAIQVLGQTGDERAVAFFRELLSKD